MTPRVAALADALGVPVEKLIKAMSETAPAKAPPVKTRKRKGEK